jgi:outer membrane autotransporter protein
VPNFRPETSLYTAVPAMALLYGRNLLDTFHERVGEPIDSRGFDGTLGNGAWGRIIGMHGQRDTGSSGIFGSLGPKYSYDFFGLQLGHDLYRREYDDNSRDSAGLYAAFGFARGRVKHFDGTHGDSDFQAYSLGGYWTHFGPSGWYLDAIVQGTFYAVTSDAHRGIPKMKTDGGGIAASLEGGYPFRLGKGFFIEPQAQLVYQYIGLADGGDVGATVRFSDVDSLAGRVGARLGHTSTWEGESGGTRKLTAWLRPNVWHEFLGTPKTAFSSANGFVPFRAELGGTWFEINAGISGQIGQSTSMFANVSYQTRFNGSSYAYNGKVGLRMSW